MPNFVFANNVNTTLAGGISPSAVSLTLSSAANLPTSIPVGHVLAITLNDAATRQNFEVIYASAVSGATLSGLQRGQEGTAALSWATGDFAYSAPTAGQQESFGQVGESNTWTGANTFNDPVSVGAATSAAHAVNLGQFPGTLSSANGSQMIPSAADSTGLIIKYGVATTDSNGRASATFATPYPTNWLTGYGNVTNLTAITGSTTVRSLNTTGIEIDVLNPSGLPIAGVNVFWLAFGY